MLGDKGVYFSANDAVYDWAIAFLNSFRMFNPGLRLILIPFNDDCERLLKLKKKYNFEVFFDLAFHRLEAIGKAFELGYAPTIGPQWFRRYATFWGPLDRFMYLDARQVVLTDLEPLILALDRYGFDFLHFDCTISQVYEPGEFHRNLLKYGRGRGFNSGRWASKKGLFTIEEFEKFSAEALKIRSQLNLRNTDQSFINYCCDMKPVCYGHFAEVLGDFCSHTWAGFTRELYREHDWYLRWDHGGLEHKKKLPLIHWAGVGLGPLMPHASLYLKFRFEKRNFVSFLVIRLWWLLLYPLVKFYDKVRRNRLFNSFYHQCRKKYC